MNNDLTDTIRQFLTQFELFSFLPEEVQRRLIRLTELVPLSEDWEADLANHSLVIRETALLKMLLSKFKSIQEHELEQVWSDAFLDAKHSIYEESKTERGRPTYKPTSEEIRMLACQNISWKQKKEQFIQVEAVFEYLTVLEKNLYARLQSIKLLQHLEGSDSY